MKTFEVIRTTSVSIAKPLVARIVMGTVSLASQNGRKKLKHFPAVAAVEELRLRCVKAQNGIIRTAASNVRFPRLNTSPSM